MDRILIIGCGGAGKSTLARSLGEKLDIPVVHLDRLFWQPGWVNASADEFDLAIRAEMDKPRWIMDGNFDRTLPERIKQADTLIYLDFPRILCLAGVLKRVLTTYGRVRPDMGIGCPERFDLDFLKWIWNFNRDKREKNYTLIAQHPQINAIILKNRKQVHTFLAGLDSGCSLTAGEP